MARIIYTNEAGTQGRMEWPEGEVFGPLPPHAEPYRAIYDRLIADGVEPEAYEPPAAAVPEVISDRQFAQALALAGTITEAEALAWAARGELPEAMEDALALIPEADGRRFGARMMLAGATTFERSHPLTGQLGGLLINPTTGKPYDAAALDALWAEAATL
ncbi:hypothetical protein [Methylorubrum extorquens]|uniref:hypothetical protein n=1 Tax=Methylorubrum extorquens TaxID=408 RepID=UPI002237EFE2|nr:hypothetical protein [Methylorubrum extorquens]UYW33612.1 hypothetical protein OKB92_05900 [Methylorubrum extorquens]